MSTLTIAHLYPQEMNTYGDSGNIIALQKRLQWRGYQVEVVDVHPGQAFDFHQTDIVFGGGGQDSGQWRIADDLAERGDELRSAAADGLPMLMVCGLYQLFGVGFLTDTGRYINGIGVFRATTCGSATRLVGNITVQNLFGTLVGFENHSGQTTLLPDQQPLGQVIKGWGNNRTPDAKERSPTTRSEPICTAPFCRRTRRSPTISSCVRCAAAILPRNSRRSTTTWKPQPQRLPPGAHKKCPTT